MIEMAVVVAAAYQRRRIPQAADLAYGGGKVADCKPDPAVPSAVGLRAVDQADVMQRHLPRLQHDINGFALIDLNADLLAAAEHVVGGEGVAMRQLIPEMAAGHDAQTPTLHSARREG